MVIRRSLPLLWSTLLQGPLTCARKMAAMELTYRKECAAVRIAVTNGIAPESSNDPIDTMKPS